MSKDFQPKAEANKISILLDTVVGKERYPVDVKQVALGITESKFPDEPIVDVLSDSFETNSFQGALVKHPKKSKWKIIYNNALKSEGRINFTLAHEFGHYILHRHLCDEFSCTNDKYEPYEPGNLAKIESEADEFASCLLMPLHDFRKQTQNCGVSIELLMHCANRYNVSLMAAALKWKDIISKRVVVVASKDGFLLWASSNKAAYKSGVYIKTKNKVVSVPEDSLIKSVNSQSICGESQVTNARIWFPDEPVDMPITEHVFVSKNDYDYTLCLLVLPEPDIP
ncbi:ImmA/IrrE family metallo-endopeptidase [Vibrio mediterranei]